MTDVDGLGQSRTGGRFDDGRWPLTWVGIGVVVFWGVVAVVGFLDPEYSHVRDAVSVVGARQAPFSLVGRGAFVVLGLAVVALAAALRRELTPSHWAAAGVVLLVVHGVGRVGEGVFAFDLTGVAATRNTLHVLFGAAAVVSMLVVPPVFAVHLSRVAGERSLAAWTVLVAALFVTLFFLLGPGGRVVAVASVDGLLQRPGFGVWYLWLVGVVLVVARRDPASGTTSP